MWTVYWLITLPVVAADLFSIESNAASTVEPIFNSNHSSELTCSSNAESTSSTSEPIPAFSASSPTEQPMLEAIQAIERNHVPMAEVALLVTRLYISTQTNTAIILKKCVLCAKMRYSFQSRLLEHFLKNFDSQLTLQLFIGRPDDRPWNYNIFIVDSMAAFTSLLFNFPDTLHEREFYFLIVLTHTPKSLFERNVMMHRIFESCLRFSVLNVVIMLEHRDGSFLFYSYRLFGRKCDQQIDVKLVNRYKNGKLSRDFLFPRHLYNLSNCTLNVTAQIVPPLLNFHGDPSNSTHLVDFDRLGGIDGHLLKILSQVLQFKISLHFPLTKSVIGEYENSTGCFGMLERHEADIAVGGFSLHQARSYFFTPSVVYHQGPFVFIVRSIGHNFGPIAQLVQPFQPVVWVTIIAIFAIAVGVIRCVSTSAQRQIKRAFIMGRNNHSPITNLLIVFLGNPIAKLPTRNFARFLLMLWMLVTFVLRSAYQAKMYDALRVARRIPLPRNLYELQQQNYTLLSWGKVAYYPDNRTMVVKEGFLERYELVEAWKEGKWTTTSMLDNLMHYNRRQWQNFRKSDLTYVEEPVYQYPLVMFFRKHSNLRVTFNKMIKYLMSAGILSHIEKIHIKRKFQNMNSGDLERVSQISSEKLQGLYSICASLLGLAVLIFLLELLSCRVQQLRRFFLWVNRSD